jgi:hypothetical protein
MRPLLLATAFLIAAAPAAMAVDFTQTIKTFDGSDFIGSDGKPAPQLLGNIVENSLLTTSQSDTIEDKNRRFFLALKIHGHPIDPPLTAEDLTVIKRAVGTYQPTAIMGQSLLLLDPASAPKN